MLVDTLIDPLAAAAATAIGRELGWAGFALIIATTRGATAEALARVREMLGRGVEALIAWNIGSAPELVQCVAAYAVPWLALDERGLGEGPVAAISGRQIGATLACRYLLSLGNARFGVVAVPGAGVREAIREALEGTAATLLDAEPVTHGGDLDGAQAAVGGLLDRADAATAILCGNDLLAMAALRECRARTLSVPQDVSVVGFGDSPLARCVTPPLTSVRVSADEIAIRATESLLLMLSGGAPCPVEPSLKLVIRESTGAALRARPSGAA